jgi:D-sedoheptulose 7-phosphate isomerase
MKPAVDTTPIFAGAIADHGKIVSSLPPQRSLLESIARRMSETIQAGKKILWCGNGGSAADSQHLACEPEAR